MYRVLKPHSLAVSFYGWNKIDTFMAAWKQAGFRLSVIWCSPSPMRPKLPLSAIAMNAPTCSPKAVPRCPRSRLPDVMPWGIQAIAITRLKTGLVRLKPLIESFTRPGDIVLDPFAAPGSTCVAAAKCGRRTSGSSCCRQYHQAGLNRLNLANGLRAA